MPKRFTDFVNEDGAAGGVGGAVGGGGIANAAGTGGVAGLGVQGDNHPPKWGEPGVNNKKRKVRKEIASMANRKPVNEHVAYLFESAKPNVKITLQARDSYGTLEKLLKYIGQCGNGGHTFSIVVDPDAQGGGKKFEWDGDGSDHLDVESVVAQVMEALDLDVTNAEIEKAAEAVHQQWMDKQKELGHEEHKSPDGKEDYMVDYEDLSHPAKELDRGAVKAVISALKSEALDPRAIKASDAYEDAMDKELGDDYGNFMELLMVTREMADDGDAKAIKKVEEMTARLKRAKAAGEAARKKVLGEAYEPSKEKFAGATVFEVDMDRVMNIKGPKHPRHRYSKYVGTDEIGEAIRQHGRKRGSGDIVLKDQKTAVMTYLRRKPVGG